MRLNLSSLKNISKKNQGFSLLELLIYMGLLAGITMVITNLFVIFSVNSANSEARTEVQQNLQFAMQNIVNEIRAQGDIGSVSINANGDMLDLKSSLGEILLRFDAQNSRFVKTYGAPGAICEASGSCKIDCATPDPDCLPVDLVGSNVSLAASNPPDAATFKNIGSTIQIKLNISYNDNGRRDHVFQQANQTTVYLR